MNKYILFAFAFYALLATVRGQGLSSLFGGGDDDNEGLDSARTRTGGILSDHVSKPVGAVVDGVAKRLGKIPVAGRMIEQVLNGVNNLVSGAKSTSRGAALFGHDAKGGLDDSPIKSSVSKLFAPKRLEQKKSKPEEPEQKIEEDQEEEEVVKKEPQKGPKRKAQKEKAPKVPEKEEPESDGESKQDEDEAPPPTSPKPKRKTFKEKKKGEPLPGLD